MKSIPVNTLRCLVLLLTVITVNRARAEDWNESEIVAQAKKLKSDEISDLRKKAEGGDPLSQFLIGLAYEYGYGGLKADGIEALLWHRRAAEQNMPLAEIWVGDFYYDGLGGVAIDYSMARKWYERGSSHGNPFASRQLGNIHVFGQGVPKDLDEAGKWFRLSINQAQGKGVDGSIDRLSLLDPSCDDGFCTAFRTILIARLDNFTPIKGAKVLTKKEGEIDRSGNFVGTTTLLDAKAFVVNDSNYQCDFGFFSKSAAEEKYRELIEKVRAALSKNWSGKIELENNLGGILKAGPNGGVDALTVNQSDSFTRGRRVFIMFWDPRRK